jgi:hypothetical protein
MAQKTAIDPKCAANLRLPRYDLVLMPLIGLVTVSALFFAIRSTAYTFFRESSTHLDDCLILTDSVTGPRGIPNSVCREKTPEDSTIEYRIDSCGYRSDFDCRPKPRGVYRIVVTGSSVAMGERVQYQQSLAALLPAEISRRTGLSMQLYDEGMAWGFARNSAARFDDVLLAEPDLILWVITPRDVQSAAFVLPTKPGATHTQPKWRLAASAVMSTHSLRPFVDLVRNHFIATDSAIMLQHLLYKRMSRNSYVDLALQGPDEENGFLRLEPSPTWKANLKEFDSSAEQMERRSIAAHIPFVAVLLPNRVQASMLAMKTWPAGCSPYVLDDELRAVITDHGGTYISILKPLSAVPNLERDYLPVDGHPVAAAHSVFAPLIAEQLDGMIKREPKTPN